MIRRSCELVALLGIAAMLAACTSAQDAGYDKFEAIKVPDSWTEASSVSGGDRSLAPYKTWIYSYAKTDQNADAIRLTYDSALKSAGWTWKSSCETKNVYSVRVKNGCWQSNDYTLVYAVLPGLDGTKLHVGAEMLQDD